MSEPTAPTTPNVPPLQDDGKPAAPAAATPPWGTDDDFDAAKAWKLIQDLRSDKDKLAARPAMTDEQRQKITEYERLEQASKTELERKTEELTRQQAETQRWRAASVTSKIEALAGSDFADPSDAIGALTDPSQYLDAGGQIDEAAIKADLAAVLDKKPHWRRQEAAPPSPRTPLPNRAQGSGANGKPTADPATEFGAVLQGLANRS